jgi:hypothetical protein
MTTEQIDPEHWRLTFPEHEATFIVNVLARLGRQYQEDPKQMSPALRAFWDGNITKGEAVNQKELTELADAQQLLVESRTELRSQRLELVENWIQEFELAESRDPWQVEVSSSDRDELVAMLNDRRLLLAFNIGVTETDMEQDPAHISDEARRHAILEIDVLGHFILVMLGPQIHLP